MNMIDEIERYARSLPPKSRPVVVGHPLVGRIGLCIPGTGFKVQGMPMRSFEALLKDERRARQYIRERQFRKLLTLSAAFAAMLPSMAITTWDGVLAARAGGLADDRLYVKGSQTTVANLWSSFFRSTGYPGAGAYTNIPGGAVMNNASAGAMLLTNPTDPALKYLINFGVQHLTGTNIVLLADLLVAAGNINANATGAQAVNTVALTRYTTGVGVMMIMEVTTALGATASNVTISYTNTVPTSGRSTGAIAMTTSCITFRTQPVAGGILIPLQAGDLGVRSVETVTFSAAMLAGVLAILLYMPLVLMPTLAITTYVERSTPGMLGGITQLVDDTSHILGCLMVFVLTSTTSTGVQTYFLQTCAG